MKKESNKKAIYIAIGVSIVLVTLAVIGVSTETVETKAPVNSNPAMIVEFKEAFMDGCMENGTVSYTECNCTYNYMEKRLGQDGLIDESTEYTKTGVFTPVMTDAVNACF